MFLPALNRMAFLTACNFLFTGFIIFLLNTDKKKLSGIAHILIIPVSLINYFVIVSYILGVYSATEISDVEVALITGIAFCGISVAVLIMRQDTWLLKVYTSSHTGGIIARKLLPPLMILPVVIAWLRIKGEREGIFASYEGVVLVAITYTVCFGILVWLTARSIDKIDQKRRASEKALSESEDRFRTIAESLPVQISITNINDGTVRFTNEAYDKSFGFKTGELIGRKAHDLYFNNEDRLILTKLLKEQGSFYNVEVKVKKADGSAFWIMASIRTITYGGEPSYLGAFIDISESKKSKDELQLLNRTLNALE